MLKAGKAGKEARSEKREDKTPDSLHAMQL